VTDFKSLAHTAARHQAEVCTDHFDKVATALHPGTAAPRPEGFHRKSPVPLTMVLLPNEPASLGSAQDITTSPEPDAVYNYQPDTDTAPPVPNIADRFADLLKPLSRRRRNALIAQLSRGYYDGWHPTRAEVAALVAEALRRSP
jgi:hypothetical protein